MANKILSNSLFSLFSRSKGTKDAKQDTPQEIEKDLESLQLGEDPEGHNKRAKLLEKGMEKQRKKHLRRISKLEKRTRKLDKKIEKLQGAKAKQVELLARLREHCRQQQDEQQQGEVNMAVDANVPLQSQDCLAATH